MKHEQNLLIKPHGSLFFRDGSAFQKGMNNWLTSKYMPNPSTFYGAVCTALLNQNKLTDLADILQNKNRRAEIEPLLERQLVLLGSYIYASGECLIPAPRDLFTDEKQWCQGQYQNGLLYSPEGFKSDSSEYFISIADYMDYYQTGKTNRIRYYHKNKIWKKNTKAGIEIDKRTRLVKESHLFILDMAEFCQKDDGYILKICCEMPLDRAIITLGGEKKTAFAAELEGGYITKQMEKYQKKICMGSRIRLLFTSPLLMKKQDLSVNQRFLSELFGTSVKLLAAAIGSLESSGGYNMAAGVQRETFYAIPAGSTLLLESDEFVSKQFGEIIDLLEHSVQNAIQLHRGFGRFLITEYEGEYE